MENVKWLNRIVPLKQGSKKRPSMIADDPTYSSLLNSSDDDSSIDQEKAAPIQFPTPPSRRPLNKYFVIFSKTVLVLLAAWGVFSIGMWTFHRIWHGTPPEQRSCSCGGTTVAEAKRQGCIFTPLAISWLPPHCIDMELSDEFDSIGYGNPWGEGWPYWKDVNGTIPLTREEVGAVADIPGGVFYTSQAWHVMHCMYTWRKHFRSKTTGVTIENRSNGLDHIHHCEGIVTAGHPMDEIWTMAGIELNADLV